MNMLSQAAVADARKVDDAIATTPGLAGVVLKGNKFGLGAGAKTAS
jgi:hypothetical protein